MERKGSITVFFSLSLTIVITLICTTIETVRLNGLQQQLDMAADSALDSMFASYDRQLLEQYGLLFLNGSGGNDKYSDLYLKNQMEEYMKYEMTPTLDTSFIGTTMYPMKLEDIRILNTVRATDFGGNVFEQEVIDYMKYKEVGDITDQLLKWKTLMEKGNDQSKKIEEAEKTLNQTDWENQSKEEELSKTTLNIVEHNIIKNGMQQDETANETEQETEENLFDQQRYDKEIESSVIHQVQEVKKGGFLKIVVPEQIPISGKQIKTEKLPSMTSVTELEWNNRSVAEKTARAVLYGEYVLKYFSNFISDEKKSGIQYETEYILFGKNSDEENLKSCINRLLWIREGLNIAHIFSSPAKMEEALAMATAMVGWAMIPPLVTAVQLVIVGSWAYAESLLDVRRLLSGKKVTLIKTEQSWQLGLSGLKNFFYGAGQSENNDENGLGYEDYMRVLLLTVDKSEKIYRTMDIVQQNMQQSVPNFEMKNYVYSAQICVEAEANQLFLTFPGVRRMWNQSNEKYRIITAVGRNY